MMSPLSGKRVLVTRAREQAAAFTKLIKERGGLSVEIPLISFEPRNDILKSIEIEKYDWILFTSANGVRFFFQHAVLPRNIKVGAVGTKTAKVLEKYGVQIDLLPEDFIAEGLVEAMSRYTYTGEKILLPRGNLGRDELPEQLSELGYDVTDLPIYNTVVPQGSGVALKELVDGQALDVITFTSSSTVHHFMKLLEAENLKDRFKGITIVVIGPITAKTLLSYGFHPHVVPENYTIEGMLKSLEQYFQQLGG